MPVGRRCTTRRPICIVDCFATCRSCSASIQMHTWWLGPPRAAGILAAGCRAASAQSVACCASLCAATNLASRVRLPRVCACSQAWAWSSRGRPTASRSTYTRRHADRVWAAPALHRELAYVHMILAAGHAHVPRWPGLAAQPRHGVTARQPQPPLALAPRPPPPRRAGDSRVNQINQSINRVDDVCTQITFLEGRRRLWTICEGRD